MVFGPVKKITSLVLSGIYVKRKFLWFINILWKLHAREKSGFQVEILIPNEILVFFSRQFH